MSTLTGLIGGGGGGLKPPTSYTTTTLQDTWGQLSSSFNANSSLTTMISFTGSGVVTFIGHQVNGSSVFQTHRIRIVVDGTAITDTTDDTQLTNNTLQSIWPPLHYRNSGGVSDNTVHSQGAIPFPLVFNSSFLIQHSNGGSEGMRFHVNYFMT